MTLPSLQTMQYRTKNTLGRILGPLGLYAAIRHKTRNEPRILMYHRFGEHDAWNRLSGQTFRHQIRYLKRDFDLVTMRDLADQLENGGIKPYQAVITVDDGYADFYDIALPVLVEEGVPATFFVTTRFIDQEIWLWPDKLEFILNGSDEPEVEQRRRWHEEVEILLDKTPVERDRYLDDFARQYGTEVPTIPTSEYRACTWDQLSRIVGAGVEIGAHTENHPRLTNLENASLQHEVEGCKFAIGKKLGHTAVSFCYPNGASEDYDDRVEAVVEHAGFRTAVAAHHDGHRGGKFSLRRLGVGHDQHGFAKSVAGVRML